MSGPEGDVLASVGKLERASTAEQTSNGIREAILDGRFPPGTALTEIPLARAFDVSRNTIREALLLLSRDGIVTLHRHRGAVVKTLEASDIRELMDARRLIEASAIDTGNPKGDLDRFAAIENAISALEAAEAARDWQVIPRADVEVHSALVALLDNSLLEGFYSQLESEMLLAVTVSTRWDDSHGQPIADEHRRIFELLRDGRREESKQLLMSHLAESEEHLLETLGDQATEDEVL